MTWLSSIVGILAHKRLLIVCILLSAGPSFAQTDAEFEKSLKIIVESKEFPQVEIEKLMIHFLENMENLYMDRERFNRTQKLCEAFERFSTKDLSTALKADARLRFEHIIYNTWKDAAEVERAEKSVLRYLEKHGVQQSNLLLNEVVKNWLNVIRLGLSERGAPKTKSRISFDKDVLEVVPLILKKSNPKIVPTPWVGLGLNSGACKLLNAASKVKDNNMKDDFYQIN